MRPVKYPGRRFAWATRDGRRCAVDLVTERRKGNDEQPPATIAVGCDGAAERSLRRFCRRWRGRPRGTGRQRPWRRLVVVSGASSRAPALASSRKRASSVTASAYVRIYLRFGSYFVEREKTRLASTRSSGAGGQALRCQSRSRSSAASSSPRSRLSQSPSASVHAFGRVELERGLDDLFCSGGHGVSLPVFAAAGPRPFARFRRGPAGRPTVAGRPARRFGYSALRNATRSSR